MSVTETMRDLARQVFTSLDKNGDGTLTEDELKRWLSFQCDMGEEEQDELWLSRWGEKEEIEFEDFLEAAQEYDWPLKAGRQGPALVPTTSAPAPAPMAESGGEREKVDEAFKELARNTFNALDKNGDGTLTEDELKRWLSFQCDMGEEEQDELWLSRWGEKEEIEFEDFLEAAQEYDWPLKAGRQGPALVPTTSAPAPAPMAESGGEREKVDEAFKELARNTFNALDKNGDGTLTEDELKRWLSFQCDMGEEEQDELWLSRWGEKEEIEFEDFLEAAQEYDWPLKAGRQGPALVPKEEPIPVLRLLVQGADFLPCESQQLGHDPYIRISYNEQNLRTKTSIMNSSPTWNEVFILEHVKGTSIKFQLFHESKSLEEKLVGEAILQENVLDRIMHRGKGGLESILYCQLYVTDQGVGILELPGLEVHQSSQTRE
ncbi:hypothetical protein GUITHDRAFT_166743, partial [Guillardia theta CCMP2712]